jgi:hypothetical protein
MKHKHGAQKQSRQKWYALYAKDAIAQQAVRQTGVRNKPDRGHLLKTR